MKNEIDFLAELIERLDYIDDKLERIAEALEEKNDND